MHAGWGGSQLRREDYSSDEQDWFASGSRRLIFERASRGSWRSSGSCPALQVRPEDHPSSHSPVSSQTSSFADPAPLLQHPTSSLTPERETKTGKNTDTHDLNNNNNTNQLPPLDSLAALSLSDPTRSLAYSYPPAPTYPPLTPTLHSSPITILSTPDKGRGVYATADLAPGTLIDISPVLLLSNEEYYGGGKEGEGKGVEGSVLRGYVFTWRGKEGGMALALGMGEFLSCWG